MKVAIRSASVAVKRTLEHIVRAAGHEPGEETPDLILDDGEQAARANEKNIPRLAVTAPARPAQLAQEINLALHALQRPLLALNGGWKLDAGARQLHFPHVLPITLTEKESLLLSVLLQAYPKPLARESLLKDIWAYDEDAETHTLETHVYRLRAKLGALHPKPCDLVTENGSYRLIKA